MLDFYEKYYFFTKTEDFFNKYTLNSPTIICACGFEQRTYRIFELLQMQNPTGDVKVLIADLRKEASPGDPYYSKAEPIITSNMNKMISIINSRGWWYKVCTCNFFDESQSYVAHQELCKAIDDIKVGEAKEDIILDISSMPRAMMFPVFKKLFNEHSHANNLFVSFTEIEPLGSQESQVVSYWQPQWLPGFEPNPHKHEAETIVWLPILGFDYRRVREILEKFTFDEIYPVVGFPSSRPLETDIIVKTHKALFEVYKVPFDNIIYVPIHDPFQLALTLTDFIRDIIVSGDKTVDFVISPLGSKPQSIGACFTALNNPNVSMLAVWPTSYNPLAAKNGESYLYWIKGDIYK